VYEHELSLLFWKSRNSITTVYKVILPIKNMTAIILYSDEKDYDDDDDDYDRHRLFDLA
jgi:hypothetical protein